MVHLAHKGKTSIFVIADDTDVFILLLNLYSLYNNWPADLSLLMGASSISDHKKGKTTLKSLETSCLLKGLSGCDTVSGLWNTGKGTVLRVLNSGRKSLSTLGNAAESAHNIRHQCISFIASCYVHQQVTDMTSLCYLVCTSKMANHKLTSAPELRGLPLTNEAFLHHVHRGQLQAAIWRCALDADPPDLNLLPYGRTMNDENKLEPMSMSTNVYLTPESVLRMMIKCGWLTCTTAHCRCSVANISCSEFCASKAICDCRNPKKILASEEIYDLSNQEDADSGFA